jgi:hypothetical protein
MLRRIAPMNETRDVTATGAGLREEAPARASILVGPAPEPDLPTPRDRAGAQLGMIILLVGGGLFWAGLAALFIYLLR